MRTLIIVCLFVATSSCSTKEQPESARHSRRAPGRAVHASQTASDAHDTPSRRFAVAYAWLDALRNGNATKLQELTALPFSQVGFFGPEGRCRDTAKDEEALSELLACMGSELVPAQPGGLLRRWLKEMEEPVPSSTAWSVVDLEELEKWHFPRHDEAVRLLRPLDAVQTIARVSGDGGCHFALGAPRSTDKVTGVFAACWVE